MVSIQIIRSSVGCFFYSRVSNAVLVIAVACADNNSLSFFGIFQSVEIGVVMTGNKNCSAVAGNKAAVVYADTVAQCNLIVTKEQLIVNSAFLNNKLAELIAVVGVFDSVVFYI